MLRAIAVFLLDVETFDIVRVHYLLDALVVVQDRQAGHLIEVSKMAVISVTTLDELIASVHQSVSLETCILQCACLSLLMTLLGPVWPLIVVKG